MTRLLVLVLLVAGVLAIQPVQRACSAQEKCIKASRPGQTVKDLNKYGALQTNRQINRKTNKQTNLKFLSI